MKKVLILIGVMVAGVAAAAQMNIVKKSDGLQVFTRETALPYDSLTNIDNYGAMPGQTLFMAGARNSGNYIETFFTNNFLTEPPSVRTVSTPAGEVDGKYFDVVTVWEKQNAIGVSICMLLKEKESGKELYFKPTLLPRAMVCTGYYEKLKRYIGHRFMSLASNVETPGGEVIALEEGKEYRCVDVAIEMNVSGPVLIMEDGSGQRVKAAPKGSSVYEFVSFEDIDSAVKRFGKKFGREIAMRHVRVGMTAEMALEAWGDPLRKRTYEGQGGNREYWTYSHNRSLEIENGKVVRVYQ